MPPSNYFVEHVVPLFDGDTPEEMAQQAVGQQSFNVTEAWAVFNNDTGRFLLSS